MKQTITQEQCNVTERNGHVVFILRQHRIIPVRRLRRPIFRQAAQKAQGILRVLPSIFVLYDGILGKQDVCRELCGVALRLNNE